jgi:hypothetical protein
LKDEGQGNYRLSEHIGGQVNHLEDKCSGEEQPNRKAKAEFFEN